MIIKKIPEYCFFDWDNTIVDTDSFALEIFSHLSDSCNLNISFSKDDMIKFNGLRFQDVFQNLFKEDASKMLELYRNIYNEKGEIPKVIDTAKILIENLKELGVKMAIISNKPHEVLNKEIEQHDMLRHFEWISGEGSCSAIKPDTAIFDYTCEKLQIKDPNQKHFIFFGDSPIDIEFSKNCNIDCVFVGLKKSIESFEHLSGDYLNKRVLFTEGDHLLFLEKLKNLN